MNQLGFLSIAILGVFTLSSCTAELEQLTNQANQLISVIQHSPSLPIPSQPTNNKGTWQDPKTGLIWDRCAIGQTWSGTTCRGEPVSLEWQDAKEYIEKFANGQAKYGYTDWRLPTIQELSSIRYCDNGWHQKTKSVSELTAQGRIQKEVSQGVEMITIPANNGRTVQIPEKCAEHGSFEPKLNVEIFPNSKYDFYWSSSVWSSDLAHNIRGVNFSVGYGGAAFFAGDEYYVRAVRSE